MLAEEVEQQLSEAGCEKHGDMGCCPQSLGSYAALLAGKSAKEITQEDVDLFSRLHTCAPAYAGGQLSYSRLERPWEARRGSCHQSLLPASAPPSPPFDCQEANVVFDSFNALLNKDFVVTEDAGNQARSAADAAPFVKVMVRGERNPHGSAGQSALRQGGIKLRRREADGVRVSRRRQDGNVQQAPWSEGHADHGRRYEHCLDDVALLGVVGSGISWLLSSVPGHYLGVWRLLRRALAAILPFHQHDGHVPLPVLARRLLCHAPGVRRCHPGACGEEAQRGQGAERIEDGCRDWLDAELIKAVLDGGVATLVTSCSGRRSSLRSVRASQRSSALVSSAVSSC